MARIIHDGQGGSNSADSQLTVIQLDGGKTLALPEGDFMSKGDILRDGQDLVLQSSDGHQVIVEGYFSALPAPTLTTPGGSTLTPELVQSFAHADTPQYAANETASDGGRNAPSGSHQPEESLAKWAISEASTVCGLVLLVMP